MGKESEPIVSVRQLDGRSIFVVDGLVQPDVVEVIYRSLRSLSFDLADYDTESTAEVQHWLHEFEPSLFKANPIFGTWFDLIVTKTQELFPANRLSLCRVHCNSHLYGDLQHAHRDVTPGVTALYFGNAKWIDDWQGEVLFYDLAGEPHQAVAPKPGRVVLFPGDILHRGGVPSRKCFEPRLSVAFKFAADE